MLSSIAVFRIDRTLDRQALNRLWTILPIFQGLASAAGAQEWGSPPHGPARIVRHCADRLGRASDFAARRGCPGSRPGGCPAWFRARQGAWNASVRPAPTVSPRLSGSARPAHGPATSLTLDLGVVDDAAPARDLLAQPRRDLVRRARPCLHADLDELADDVRFAERGGEIAAQPRDSGGGRAGRREQAVPGRDLEIRDAGFADGRHVRQRRGPRLG